MEPSSVSRLRQFGVLFGLVLPLALVGCVGSKSSVSLQRMRPSTITDARADTAPSLGVLIGESDLAIVGEVRSIGKITMTSAAGGGSRRYTEVSVGKVLKGDPSLSGKIIDVFGEGGWDENGDGYQFNDIRWTYSGDRAIYLLKEVQGLALDNPAYTLRTGEARFLAEKDGKATPSAHTDWADRAAADTSFDALADVVASTPAENPPALNAPVADGPQSTVAKLQSPAGEVVSIVAAHSAGGFCYGFGTGNPEAKACVRFEDMLRLDRPVIYIIDPDLQIVFGIARPGTKEVALGTNKGTFLVSTATPPFDSAGWTYFVRPIASQEKIVSAIEAPANGG